MLPETTCTAWQVESFESASWMVHQRRVPTIYGNWISKCLMLLPTGQSPQERSLSSTGSVHMLAASGSPGARHKSQLFKSMDWFMGNLIGNSQETLVFSSEIWECSDDLLLENKQF